MTNEAEREFHKDMINSVNQLKRAIPYNASRFIQMVAAHGGVDAARQLLGGPNAADGFTTLWEHGRLEMSVEAYVLLPWYRELFSDREREVARDRLERHEFDVASFFRRAEADPPAWTSEPSA